MLSFSSRRRHRICLSDWSSGVCSSHLSRSAGDARHGRRRHFARRPVRKRTRERAQRRGGNQHNEGGGRFAEYGRGKEIGRASCRERGEISVVRGYIKKKI